MRLAPLALALALTMGALTGDARASDATATAATPATEGARWQALPTEPYRGKQDDIVFVDAENGLYANGLGRIFRTTDGGRHWDKVHDTPGTYFRALGMIDAQHGFAGNIGTDYFPGVTDTRPLYRTADGGRTWTPVDDPTVLAMRGVCAIDIVHEPFINAGELGHRTVVHVGGRVGGPAHLLRSLDGGATWSMIDLSAQAGMIVDVKFFDAQRGLVFAATDAAIEQANALILRTEDGGATWTPVYRSTRGFEITWKGAFPTPEVGYATIQSYDPDPARSQRYVAKTTDGGRTWTEMPLVDDAGVRAFGVGFLDAERGWVGTNKGGFETRDGGATWTAVDLGRVVNKIRVLHTPDGPLAYAIGADVYRFGPPLADLPAPPAPAPAPVAKP